MNTKFYVNLDKYKQDIIDAFVRYYGEDKRYEIIRRYNKINFNTYIEIGSCLQELCNQEKLNVIINHDIKDKNKAMKEIEFVENYIQYHNKVRDNIVVKNLNKFIEKYKNILLPNDIAIWNKTHDYRQLECLEMLIFVDDYDFETLESNQYYNEDKFFNEGIFCLGYYSGFLYDHNIANNKLDQLITEKETHIMNQNPNKEIQVDKKILDICIDMKTSDIFKNKYKSMIASKSYLKGIRFDEEEMACMDEDRLDMIYNIQKEYESMSVSMSRIISDYPKSKNYNKYSKPLKVIPAAIAYMMDTPEIKKHLKGYNIKKEGTSIFFSPTSPRLGSADKTLIHEISHAISAYNYDKKIYIGFHTGFKNFNSSLQPEPEITIFDEIINDKIARDITNDLHDRGIYIYEKTPLKINFRPSLYEYDFSVIDSFFEDNKEEILNANFYKGFEDLSDQQFLKAKQFLNISQKVWDTGRELSCKLEPKERIKKREKLNKLKREFYK